MLLAASLASSPTVWVDTVGGETISARGPWSSNGGRDGRVGARRLALDRPWACS